ncbi:MAG: hypothetical protein AB7N76_31825 [Planctomycetota bacterium]
MDAASPPIGLTGHRVQALARGWPDTPEPALLIPAEPAQRPLVLRYLNAETVGDEEVAADEAWELSEWVAFPRVRPRAGPPETPAPRADPAALAAFALRLGVLTAQDVRELSGHATSWSSALAALEAQADPLPPELRLRCALGFASRLFASGRDLEALWAWRVALAGQEDALTELERTQLDRIDFHPWTSPGDPRLPAALARYERYVATAPVAALRPSLPRGDAEQAARWLARLEAGEQVATPLDPELQLTLSLGHAGRLARAGETDRAAQLLERYHEAFGDPTQDPLLTPSPQLPLIPYLGAHHALEQLRHGEPCLAFLAPYAELLDRSLPPA